MTKMTDTYDDAKFDNKITKGQCLRQVLCRFDVDNLDDDDNDVDDDHPLHHESIHAGNQRH